MWGLWIHPRPTYNITKDVCLKTICGNQGPIAYEGFGLTPNDWNENQV